MSDPYSSVTRRTSSSFHHTQSLSPDTTRQRTDANRASREVDPNTPKRKSNAYLAAEAVQQERDAIKTLKRLSMGGSLTVDPDLPYGVDNEYGEYQKNRSHRRRSSSGSSISSQSSLEDDAERTLIEETSQDSIEDEEDVKIDSEKLLWVPAKSHPSIAPDQFRRHVQSTLDDMNKKIKDKSSDSIPSLKELTDELDKLSEMAGLAATDAVTLARSLSSASSSSSLLYGDEITPELNPSDAGSSQGDARVSEDDVDQDAPLLAAENSLKRSKWTTYSRRNRTDKDKQKRRHSPLSEDHYRAFQEQGITGGSDKSLPPSPDGMARNTQPLQRSQRSVSSSDSPRHYTQTEQQQQLSRSQSDISGHSKKTNHTRNRHAGSLINLETTPSGERNVTPPPISKDSQRQQRRVSPLTSEMERHNSQHSEQLPHQHQHQYQQQHSQHPQQQHPQQHHPQQCQSTHHQPQQRQRPQLTLQPQQAYQTQQHQQQQQLPPTPRTPPLQQYGRPETQVANEVPEPPTPLQPVVKEKEKEKENDKENKSKSKEFLNMFKMKRSTSPKSKDRRRVTPTRSAFNDENIPLATDQQSYPNQQYKQQQSQQSQSSKPPQKSPQRPSLRPTSFKLMQKKDESRKEQQRLQESVSVVPKNASSRSPSPSKASANQQSPEPTPSQFAGSSDEQHRAQRESIARKLSLENIKKPSKPNAPVQFTDSAFGFPLPPLSHSTIIMLDYRFPVHVERALYRLSHLKLANPRRQLRQQVLLSNFMYAYLNLVNHTLYLQQLDEDKNEVEGAQDGL